MYNNLLLIIASRSTYILMYFLSKFYVPYFINYIRKKNVNNRAQADFLDSV